MPGGPDNRHTFELIDLIYAAACDPSLWPKLVATMEAAFPGVMFTVEMLSRGPQWAVEGAVFTSYPQESAASYLAHYHKINPYLPLFNGLEVGQIIRLSNLMSPRDVEKYTFYHEWLKPAGDFTFGTGAVLVREKDRMLRASIDIPARCGHLELPLARLLATLGPHLVRAFEVNDRLQTAALTQSCLDRLIGRIEGAAYIVSPRSHILSANDMGEAQLRSGRLVRAREGQRLVFLAPKQESAYRRALASACDPARAGGDVTLRVACPQLGEAALMVLPLSTTVDGAVLTPVGRLALVIIRPASIAPRCPKRQLRLQFGLTSAEAEVVALLVAGRDVAEIAATHNVAKSTVRNQIAAILDKMHVRRQAELIILVASLTPGLAFEE